MTLKELEQTLRRLVEQQLGGKFRGRVHPLEVARTLVAEMVRESQSWLVDHVAPNDFYVHLHPGEELSYLALGDPLNKALFAYLSAEARERELRWIGPVTFTFKPDPSVPSGRVEVYAHIDGPQGVVPPTWKDVTLEAPTLVGLSGFAEGRSYPIRLPRSIVGRDETCDVRLGDPRVSHRHAIISWHDDSFWIEDLGSTAGTICNGQPVEGTMALRNGDVLVMGFSTLRFEEPTPGPAETRVNLQAVLFDRDGTLVVNVPYNGDPDRVELCPTAVEAIALLRQQGLRLAVVSNQSGVGRGLIDMHQVEAVNRRIETGLGQFEGWFMCPHAPEDRCACRKPLPTLVLQAAQTLGVPPSSCMVVGDRGADVQAALAAGAQGILVPSHDTPPSEVAIWPHAPTLLAAARWITTPSAP